MTKNNLLWVDGIEGGRRTELVGARIEAEKVTGSKETRCEPFAIQWEHHNVMILRHMPGRKELVEELGAFPTGSNDDQVRFIEPA